MEPYTMSHGTQSAPVFLDMRKKAPMAAAPAMAIRTSSFIS